MSTIQDSDDETPKVSYEDIYQQSYNAFHDSQVPDHPKTLTHVDVTGRANMVDVGGKEITQRSATAIASIEIGQEAYKLVSENGMKKGDT